MTERPGSVGGGGGGAPGVEIRRRTLSASDVEAYVAVFAAVKPDEPTDAVQVRWAAEHYPEGADFLVEDEAGAVVAAATVGRVYMYDAAYDAYWTDICVLPQARRRGIGGALLAACSAEARAAGKAGLLAPASAARPEGIAFLERRGFGVVERAKMVRLDLAGLKAPTGLPPDGYRLTTLSERPDLVEAVHAVAIEAYADIPGEAPMSAGHLNEFRARDVERPGIVPEAFVIALDPTGAAAGFASLLVEDGHRDIGFHDMTAVARAHRGRGLARAMKEATIAWAVRAGLSALETGNDEANGPMRAVNRRLGYRPLPDSLLMRGPLSDGIMTP